MFALPYPLGAASDPASGADPLDMPASGTLALYARGRDYHRAVGALLKRIVHTLAERYPGEIFRPFCDTLPLPERFYAERARLGHIVRSGMLANTYFGTRFVLGGIAASLAFAEEMPEGPYINMGAAYPFGHTQSGGEEGARSALPPECSACSACVQACPASALRVGSDQGFCVDASRCLAWLSIEYKGVVERERWRVFGGCLFGCDACQDVCPYNSARPGRETFSHINGALFASAHAPGASLPLAEILSIKDQDSFVRRFSGTALMRAGRRGLVRNAIIVAANTRSASAVPLVAALERDQDEVIAATARMACAAFLR